MQAFERLKPSYDQIKDQNKRLENQCAYLDSELQSKKDEINVKDDEIKKLEAMLSPSPINSNTGIPPTDVRSHLSPCMCFLSSSVLHGSSTSSDKVLMHAGAPRGAYEKPAYE